MVSGATRPGEAQVLEVWLLMLPDTRPIAAFSPPVPLASTYCGSVKNGTLILASYVFRMGASKISEATRGTAFGVDGDRINPTEVDSEVR